MTEFYGAGGWLRRRRALGIALGIAAILAPTASAKQFTHGVAAGEITARSAVLWTRFPAPGVRLRLEVARDARFRRVVRRATIFGLSRARDWTVRPRVPHLRPATTYHYRFLAGRVSSPVGRFRTAPLPSARANVRFAITGDADGTKARGRPFFNAFGVYARMAGERNDFNLNVGDTMYSDSNVGGAPPALTVRQKWAKYRENWSYPAHGALRRSAGLYSHWDDHEFINDFTRAEHGDAIFRAGVRAFLDYNPVTWSQAAGLYRTFRWGRNLELFLLDERSFRSAKASAGPACRTPSGAPDIAPTAPQAVRNAFAPLAPSLALPVAPACLDLIRDPRRTMLGAAQLARFSAAVRRSTATFKVVISELPIQQFYANPYDRWEGYEAERGLLLALLYGVDNVVFLSTDIHGILVGEVRLLTLEPGGPIGTGILEATVGPVATNTFAKQVDATLGSVGSGNAVAALFLKPAPPRGIGMRCAAIDVYSYLQVRVTGAALTITPKDQNGRLVQEPGGAPCGPFVVRAGWAAS
jgi:alkaline phosphatase D